MSDNIYQFPGCDPQKGGRRTFLEMDLEKGMEKSHALLLKKIEVCKELGKNPASQLMFQITCYCKHRYAWPDVMALPHFNAECPKCKSYLVKWNLK